MTENKTETEIKTEDKKDRAYQFHYENVIETMELLNISLVNGIINHPLRSKTDQNDVVSMICSYRSEQKLPPINPRTIIKDIVQAWVDKATQQEYKKLSENIAYDSSIKDEWKEMMTCVFGKYDETDAMVLKHQVWIMKRRISKLPVDQSHCPLFVNIYDEKRMGKSLFLEEFLFAPIPKSKIHTIGDMSQAINDERHYDIFADNFVVIFAERGKGDKVNGEIHKMLIDSPKLCRRNLGLNSHAGLPNNATQFGTSNHRIRDTYRDENPRKLYEIDFPSRSTSEVAQYLEARKAFLSVNLWKCINENEDTELLKRWDAVQSRIDLKCRYVAPITQWIYSYVVKRGVAIINDDILFSDIWQTYTSENAGNEYKVNQNSMGRRLVECGFERKQVDNARGYEISLDTFNDISAKFAELQGGKEIA